MLSSNTKSEAIILRRRGDSLFEISKQLNISKSTASLLLRNITLDAQTLLKINNKREIARRKALITIKENRYKVIQEINIHATSLFDKADLSNELFLKIICALLYWGEGGKTDNYVSFINSDPKMISVFLHAFRKSFEIDEKKFRGLVHLHEYHNEGQIKQYWSSITKIPESQFTKSFRKQNTGINKHKGYNGTLKIKYFDYRIALELKAIYNCLVTKIGV